MLVFVICVVVAPVRQRNEAWDKLGDRQYLNPEVKGLAVKVDSAKVKDIDVVSPFTGGSVFGHFWVIAETPTGGSIWLRQCRIVGEPNWTGDNLPEGK